jgi:hypothetical protein
MIIVIHTFGDYARFHPHLDTSVADGMFPPNGALVVSPKERFVSWRRSAALGELDRAEH